MKRIPENNPRSEGDNYPSTPDSDNAVNPTAFNELEGLVGLGMKREALRLARRRLKNCTLSADMFNDCLDAILQLTNLD